MEFVDAGEHAFQKEFHKRRIGVRRLFFRLSAAGIEQREIGIYVLEVVSCLRERRIAEAFGMQQGGLQHAADAAIAVPEGMDQLIVIMHQWRANQRGHILFL